MMANITATLKVQEERPVVWSERHVVYYSKDRQYAVRWRDWEQAESEAHFQRFPDRLAAERFYNHLLLTRGDAGPLELFSSQTKWIRYSTAYDQHGIKNSYELGLRSPYCTNEDHTLCLGVQDCTCPCHSEVTVP